MSLETRDLRLVAAVAEHGSLTRAGLVLHLTQSALSHQLADLERRVGAPLFARLGKRMVLTPSGERLREASHALLAALAQAEDEVRAVSAERDAVLRLSTECYTCYHWLPPVITAFKRGYPKVEVRIVAEATRRPVAALLRGRLDVAIVSGPLQDRRLRARPLFQDELVAVVAPDHSWARRSWVDAADFASEHLISYLLPREESTLFRDVLLPAGVMPRQYSEVHLTEAIVELIRAGLGVSVLARWAVAPQLKTGTLRGVRITEPGLLRTWSAVLLRYKHEVPHLTAFADLLAKEAFAGSRAISRIRVPA